MSAIRDTATGYAKIRAARWLPHEQWRNYHKWVRFYLHFCHQCCHRPAYSTSLQLCLGKLAPKGQTAEQRPQARCTVEQNFVGRLLHKIGYI